MGCAPNELWSFVIHGWRDGPSTSSWLPTLVENLNKYRGGCVIVMDFFNYSKAPDYFTLVNNFAGISTVLSKKLYQVLREGFLPKNGFMFGFSFGAHLVYDVGIRTNGTISRINSEPIL